MKTFSIIAAMDQLRGIGVDNRLPWHLSEDLKHFARTTKGGTVIMGRKTWDSIPYEYRPFKHRLNIVISTNPHLQLPEGVVLAGSLEEALELSHGATFVIGGATLFEQAIHYPNCTQLILTEIENIFDCDAFFPEIPPRFLVKWASEHMQEDDVEYRIFKYLAQGEEDSDLNP
jgi:dihydrofolate reductase